MAKLASLLSRSIILRYVIVLSAFHFGAGLQAAALPEAEAEIGHLLLYLERSNCKFFRNGRWHSGPEARAHLERKYRYLRSQDSITTTDEFIEQVATGSRMSSQGYQVKCDGAEQVPSAVWLRTELIRLRQAATAERP